MQYIYCGEFIMAKEFERGLDNMAKRFSPEGARKSKVPLVFCLFAVCFFVSICMSVFNG